MTMPKFGFVMERESGESVYVEIDGDAVLIGQKNEDMDRQVSDDDLIALTLGELKEFHHLLGEALDGLE